MPDTSLSPRMRGPSWLARLLGRGAPPACQPLWHACVGLARDKAWYTQGHIADTLAGRFDAVTLVLALVLLRMEGEPALTEPAVRLTELFVDDMDGQLRESGVGDLVVGKHIGRLMSVLGGRLGAYRAGLAADDAALAEALMRNTTLRAGADTTALTGMARALAARLAATPTPDLLAGRIAA